MLTTGPRLLDTGEANYLDALRKLNLPRGLLHWLDSERIQMKIKIKDIKRGKGHKSLTQQKFSNLRASIAAHGIINPITVDKDMNLVDGFARVCVAKDLGIKEIEVEVLNISLDLENNPRSHHRFLPRVKSLAIINLHRETAASTARCIEALKATDYDVDKAKLYLMKQPKRWGEMRDYER